MLEIKLIGVGCSKSWKMEDRLIALSRELGIPVQITKVMDLDDIISLNLSTIPVILHRNEVWPYEEIMQGGRMKQLLISLNDLSEIE